MGKIFLPDNLHLMLYPVPHLSGDLPVPLPAPLHGVPIEMTKGLPVSHLFETGEHDFGKIPIPLAPLGHFKGIQDGMGGMGFWIKKSNTLIENFTVFNCSNGIMAYNASDFLQNVTHCHTGAHTGGLAMSQNVTPKQAKAIVALGNGQTVQQAAELAGVQRRTVQRWLTDPTFRAAVARASGCSRASG